MITAITGIILVPDGIVTLIDAALRSMLAAAMVWAVLGVFRARNVLVQKAAWGLVLAGALLMPLFAPWAARVTWVPAEATLVLPGQAWLQHLIFKPHPSKTLNDTASLGSPALAAAVDAMPVSAVPRVAERPIVSNADASHADRFPAPAISNSRATSVLALDRPANPAERFFLPLSEVLCLLYGAVTAALLLRLLYGLGASVKLWYTAEPVQIASWPYLASGLRLRSSRRISSPVTLGSGVVLPADYDEWDEEKLRIVLAHERSHVRQGDFYIQALAGLYAALFWFSPLGWWLKRRLADLSEAISDRAGIEEAASHASYAQILLEFAALPRLTQIGVAMAHSGRLGHRIERLLNENSFRQAFAGGRRRILAALILVPAVLFAATALIRVEAAQSPEKTVTTTTPVAGQSHPEEAPDVAPEIAPAPAKVSVNGDVLQAPVAPTAPPAPAVAPAPPTPGVPAEDAAAPEPPAPARPAQEPAPPAPSSSRSSSHSSSHSHQSSGDGPSGSWYWNYHSDDDDAYAVVRGNNKGHMTYSGDWSDGHRGDIDRARAMAHGDFLWFSHDGKSYLIDDPQTLAQIEAMYTPIEDLGRQQEALGRQQEELGRKQEELGRQQEQASVPTPDVTKVMAELNAAVAKLQTKKGGTVTQEQLAELESKIGELQGKLGDLQGEIGAKQGELGDRQGELGAQQGKLGEMQGKLGDQQGRLAQQADSKVKSIIDQSLKNGKAKPVQ